MRVFPSLFSVLALFASLAGATEPVDDSNDDRAAVILPKGIPLVAYSNCSGAVVTSRIWGDKPLFSSGRHCFRKSANEESLAYRGSAYSSGAVLGVFNPAAKALDFDLKEAELRNAQDVVLTELDSAPRRVRVLRLAQKFPEIGASISLWGYPGKGVPGFAMKSGLARFDCQYRGPVLYPKDANGLHRAMTVYHLAECEPHVFVEGMSGGPVLNEAGEYIGVISMLLPPTVRFPKHSEQKSFLFFSGISEEEIETRRKTAVTPYRFLPRLEGTRHYPLMNMITSRLEGEESYGPGAPPPSYVGEILTGHFDLPFVKDLLHGESLAYDGNGRPWLRERWEDGHYQGVVEQLSP